MLAHDKHCEEPRLFVSAFGEDLLGVVQTSKTASVHCHSSRDLNASFIIYENFHGQTLHHFSSVVQTKFKSKHLPVLLDLTWYYSSESYFI